MAELIAGILLVAGALYLVLKPVFQPRFAEVGKGDGGSVEGGEDPDDDLSPGAVALRALKEIEFDRATGKLSDTDYDALKAEYTVAALAALRTEHGSREQDAHGSHCSPLPAPCSRLLHPRPPSRAGCRLLFRVWAATSGGAGLLHPLRRRARARRAVLSLLRRAGRGLTSPR